MWHAASDLSGRLYYYNSESGETSWMNKEVQKMQACIEETFKVQKLSKLELCIMLGHFKKIHDFFKYWSKISKPPAREKVLLMANVFSDLQRSRETALHNATNYIKTKEELSCLETELAICKVNVADLQWKLLTNTSLP